MSRKKPSDRLKSEVEHQSSRLRALADEIDRHAAEHGLFGGRQSNTEHAWAVLVRDIAEDLTRTVNQGPGAAGAVGVLNKAAMGIVASLMYFAPTANQVATDWVLPDSVSARAQTALDGGEQLDIAVGVAGRAVESGSEPDDDASQGTQEERRLRDLVDDVHSQLERSWTDAVESATGIDEHQIPWVEVHDGDEPGTFRALLHSDDWSVPVEVLIEASADSIGEISSIVESWVDFVTGEIQTALREDYVASAEIDRRLGK